MSEPAISHPIQYRNRRKKRHSRATEDRGIYVESPFNGLPVSRGAKTITKLNGGFSDSAFGDNKFRPVHRWVPWIAGFSGGFVGDVFARYLPGKPREEITVLDPFCGVGTTLVEAVVRGYNTVGFEINPYPALAAKAKLEAAAVSPSQFYRYIERFQQFMEGSGITKVCAMPPMGFKSRIPFFGDRTEPKVLRLLQFIHSVRVPPIRDLFSLAFGSVMVSISNYSYEPSLSSRPAVGKPVQDDAPVVDTMLAKLRAMHTDITWFRELMDQYDPLPRTEVVNDSFMNALRHLERNSVDLVVTSPPYLNNYHYIRNTRPQLFWLGFIRRSGELKRLETENFGKYWQTVREQGPLSLGFEMPDLERRIDTIRGIGVERGIYGGAGWANYAVAYFNDTYEFCRVLGQVLRPKSYAVIVVGNSILHGVELKIDDILAAIAGLHGLRTENIHIVRQKRVGASIVASSVRQGRKSTATLYESAVVLRKP